MFALYMGSKTTNIGVLKRLAEHIAIPRSVYPLSPFECEMLRPALGLSNQSTDSEKMGNRFGKS